MKRKGNLLVVWASLVSAALSQVAVAEPSSSALRNGDVNGDGSIDVSDTIYLLNWRFLGGPEPVEFLCQTEPERTESTRSTVDSFAGDSTVGVSRLIRSPGGVTMTLESVLPPGHTATVWWVV